MKVGEVRVLIRVKDLDAEAAFWTDQLHCATVRQFDGGVMLAVGADDREFFQIQRPANPT